MNVIERALTHFAAPARSAYRIDDVGHLVHLSVIEVDHAKSMLYPNEMAQEARGSERGTRRREGQGERENLILPCLLIPLSPCLPLSLSRYLCVPQFVKLRPICTRQGF